MKSMIIIPMTMLLMPANSFQFTGSPNLFSHTILYSTPTPVDVNIETTRRPQNVKTTLIKFSKPTITTTTTTTSTTKITTKTTTTTQNPTNKETMFTTMNGTTPNVATTVNLQNELEETEKAKEEAEAKLEVAEKTKAAAEEASSTTALVNAKIDELIGTTATTISEPRRMKRDVMTTSSNDTPTSCQGFLEMVDDLTDAVTAKKYSKATKIGNSLVSVDKKDVSCSSSEIESLENKKAAVTSIQATLVAEISELESEIETQSAAISVFEAAISEINAQLKTTAATTTTATTTTETTTTATTTTTTESFISTIQRRSTIEQIMDTTHNPIIKETHIFPTKMKTIMETIIDTTPTPTAKEIMETTQNPTDKETIFTSMNGTTTNIATTVNLQNELEEAEKAKEEAEAKLEEAEKTKSAAEEASSTTVLVNAKIDQLIGTTTTTISEPRRMKRDVMTTSSYNTPTSCQGFLEMVDDLTDAVTAERYSMATKIGNALVAVDKDDFSCSSSEIESLENKKDAITSAQTQLAADISELEDEIVSQSSIITILEATISEINEQLVTEPVMVMVTEPVMVMVTEPVMSSVADGTYLPTVSTLAGDTSLPMNTNTTISTGECCQLKKVGIYNYKLVDPNGDTDGTECLNTCVYQKIGSPNLEDEFCFKLGFNQVECTF